jgi:hypothetical protein
MIIALMSRGMSEQQVLRFAQDDKFTAGEAGWGQVKGSGRGRPLHTTPFGGISPHLLRENAQPGALLTVLKFAIVLCNVKESIT